MQKITFSKLITDHQMWSFHKSLKPSWWVYANRTSVCIETWISFQLITNHRLLNTRHKFQTLTCKFLLISPESLSFKAKNQPNPIQMIQNISRFGQLNTSELWSCCRRSTDWIKKLKMLTEKESKSLAIWLMLKMSFRNLKLNTIILKQAPSTLLFPTQPSCKGLTLPSNNWISNWVKYKTELTFKLHNETWRLFS